MVKVAGVRFKKTAPITYYEIHQQNLAVKDCIIASDNHCDELGWVVNFKDLPLEDLPTPLLKVKRLATEHDLEKKQNNEVDSIKAYQMARQKIKDHHLDMKLVEVEYSFDRNKMIFYFTADGRVDFRDLVKDLASEFKTRIELRQIGVRDEAKLLGGIGPCGRPLCCSTFLGEFVPVSIKMAKDQNLSLNPAKISGICGRLMCCLQYENEEYENAKKEMPDYGKTIVTPDGKGRVVGLNLLSRVIKVRLEGRETALNYTLEEINNAQKVSH